MYKKRLQNIPSLGNPPKISKLKEAQASLVISMDLKLPSSGTIKEVHFFPH